MAICLDFVKELLVIVGGDRREHSTKLNLINHSDRQARTEPILPRTITGDLGNGGGGTTNI